MQRNAKVALFAAVAVAALSGVSAQADTILGWDVNGQSAWGTNSLAPQTPSPAVVSSIIGLTKGSGWTASGNAAGRAWGGTGFTAATAADGITANKYATFGFTVSPGANLSLSTISESYRRSATGPASGLWQYSLNGGAFTDISTVSFSNNTSSGATLSVDLSGVTALQNVAPNTALTFRIVPFGASNAGGTWYVFDVANTPAADLSLLGTFGSIGPATLNWAPNGVSTAWDTNSSANWSKGGVAGSKFNIGDTVNFTDSGVASNGGVVTIAAAGVAPAAVNVSNSTGTYYFKTGAINDNGATPTTVAMNGAGTLDLTGQTTNGFTGGFTLNNGTVVVSDTAQLGNGAVTLAGGTLKVSSSGLANPTKNINITANSAIDTNGKDVTYTGQLSSAYSVVLTKANTGTLTLDYLNTNPPGFFRGNVNITGGTLRLTQSDANGYTAIGGAIGVNGGSSTGTVKIFNNATLYIDNTNGTINQFGTAEKNGSPISPYDSVPYIDIYSGGTLKVSGATTIGRYTVSPTMTYDSGSNTYSPASFTLNVAGSLSINHSLQQYDPNYLINNYGNWDTTTRALDTTKLQTVHVTGGGVVALRDGGVSSRYTFGGVWQVDNGTLQVGPFLPNLTGGDTSAGSWNGPYGQPLNALGFATPNGQTYPGVQGDPDLPNPVFVNANGKLAIAVDQVNGNTVNITNGPTNPTPTYIRASVTLNGGTVTATGNEVDFNAVDGNAPQATPNSNLVTAKLGGNFAVTSLGGTVEVYDSVGGTAGARTVALVEGSRKITTATFALSAGTTLYYTTNWAGPVTVDGGANNVNGTFHIARTSNVDGNGQSTVTVASGASITTTHGAILQLDGVNVLSGPSTLGGADLNYVAIQNNTAISAGAPNGGLYVATGSHNVGPVTGTGDATVASSATLSAASVTQSNLTVNGTLVIRPSATPTVSKVSSLTIAGATDAWTGKLDLNNDLIIQVPQGQDVNAAYAKLVNQLNAGSQGGVWTGTTGITSSSAANSGYTMGLGAVPNAQLNSFGIGYTAFDNVAVDDNSILVKYTLMGDVNLDGTIDSLDYYLIDSAFNNNQIPENPVMTGYINGDFNYDGTIDSADYFYIDSNYNNGGPAITQTRSAPVDADTYTYDAAGQLATHTDRTGLLDSFTYDPLGRCVATVRTGIGINQTTRATFDALGQTLTTTDGRGDTTTKLYDGWGRLAQVQQPIPDDTGTPPTTTYTYDDASRVLTVKDANQHTTTNQYDLLGRTTQVTAPDPDGTGPLTAPVVTYHYLVNGDQNTVIDPLAHPTTIVLDRFGRTAQMIQPSPDGNAAPPITSYTYDADGNVLTVTDPLGNLPGTTDATAALHTTTFTYDTLGRRITQTTPAPDAAGLIAPSVTTWSYDLLGNLLTVTDPNDNTTTYTYDNRNQRIQTTYAAPSTGAVPPTVTYQYNDAGDQIAVTDALGHVQAATYDQLHRKTEDRTLATLTPLSLTGTGTTATLTFASTSLQAGDTLVVAGADQTVFDGTFTVTSATATTATFTLPTAVAANLTATGPLAVSILLTRQDYTYDANNNLLTVTNALGQTTTTAYDRLNRKTSVTQPVPAGADPATAPVTTYTYDAVGNLLTLKDPDGNTTTYVYDHLNRLYTDTNQAGATRTYTYDANGNQTELRDRDGRTIDATYDHLNRLTRQSSGGQSITYTYDAAGHTTGGTDSASGVTEAFTYDNLGRLTTQDSSFTGLTDTLTQAWSYDPAGNTTAYSLATDTTPEFANAYTYDGLNRLTLLTQTGPSVRSKSVAFGYNALGQYTTVTRYSDLAQSTADKVAATSYTYDSANRLTAEYHALGVSGATVRAYSQTYDLANHLTTFTTPDGTSAFTYDPTGQLTGVTAGAMPAENYTYTANGNRIGTDYTTGADNQTATAPVGDGTTDTYTYAYDAEGNRTRRIRKTADGATTVETVTYAWDFRNRLTQVQTYTGTAETGTLTQTVTYGYDAFDHRVRTTITDETTHTVQRDERFLYDGPNLAATFDAAILAVQQVYLSGLGQNEWYAEDTVAGASAGTRWLLTDHQGTVRDVVSQAGTLRDHYVYSSFGRILSVTQSQDPGYVLRMGYTGQIHDAEAGLDYYNARYYDAEVGKFLSVDPLGYAAGDGNMVRYCNNTPTSFRDPSGLDPSESKLLQPVTYGPPAPVNYGDRFDAEFKSKFGLIGPIPFRNEIYNNNVSEIIGPYDGRLIDPTDPATGKWDPERDHAHNYLTNATEPEAIPEFLDPDDPGFQLDFPDFYFLGTEMVVAGTVMRILGPKETKEATRIAREMAFFWGNNAHWLIAKNYLLAHPTGAWTNFIPIETIIDEVEGASPSNLSKQELSKMPDILDKKDYAEYEIKSEKWATKNNVANLAKWYVGVLRKAGGPLCHTHLGASNAPGTSGDVLTIYGELKWRSPADGVILYKWDTRNKAKEDDWRVVKTPYKMPQHPLRINAPGGPTMGPAPARTYPIVSHSNAPQQWPWNGPISTPPPEADQRQEDDFDFNERETEPAEPVFVD